VLYELEISSELILAPTSHVTPHSSAVTELVAELVPAGGKTGSVDVPVVEVDPLTESEDGEVVAETPRIVSRMSDSTNHIVLLVLILLRCLVSAGVVLPDPHLQAPHTHHVLEVVGSSKHLGRPSRVVVVEVLWDDGAGADEVVVGVEDEAGPGELSGAGLSVTQSRGRSGVEPLTALLLTK